MHPTGGTRRVFRQFAWLEAGSVKMALSRPTHQRVTPAVGQQYECQKVGKEFMIDYIKNHRLTLLLAGIALLTILRIAIPFHSGYSGSLLYIILFCTEGI